MFLGENHADRIEFELEHMRHALLGAAQDFEVRLKYLQTACEPTDGTPLINNVQEMLDRFRTLCMYCEEFIPILDSIQNHYHNIKSEIQF